MNPALQSAIRHALTGLFAWLALKLAYAIHLDAAATAAVSESFSKFVEPSLVIVVAVVGRGLVWLLGRFPGLNFILGGSPATSGGSVANLLLLGAATVSMVGLSSCQNFNPASALPPRTSLTAFYGTKGGTTVGVTIGNNQTPPAKVEISTPAAPKPETAQLLTTTPTAEKMPATLPVVPTK